MTSLFVENRLDMPNLIDLFQQWKGRALALDLTEDQIGKEGELISLEEQHMPVSIRGYQFRQLLSERLFYYLIEIVRHLLSPNQHGSRISPRKSELDSLYSELDRKHPRYAALILMFALA